MSENDDLSILKQDRADLDEEIAAEARLVADDGEIPAPEVESPTPTAVETPTPANQTAILAAIGKLEAEGKFAEASPLRRRSP